MAIHATLMLPWGALTVAAEAGAVSFPEAVTDGGGEADMRRASSRLGMPGRVGSRMAGPALIWLI
jgi:hypothetical protein